MNVTLRDTLEVDFPTLFEQQCDPVACEMAAFTPRDEEEFMAHWKKIVDDPDTGKKTILVDGEVAGFVVSFERSDTREIGYWVGREYWGMGVATAALSRFLRCETGRPLHAVVASHNTASIRVLLKCGFVVEGLVREPDATGEPGIEETVLRLDGDEVTC